MNALLLAAESAAEAASDAGILLRNAWIFPAIPFVSFWVILFFGKKMRYKGAEVGIAALSVCFLLALGAGGQWISHVNASEEGEHAAPAGAVVGVGEVAAGESAAEADAEHSEAEADHSEGTAADDGEHGGAAGDEAHAEEGHASVEPVHRTWTWFQSGGLNFTVGTFVDGLSVMMLLVVALISLLVHIYSTDYVHGDIRYTHFFAFLSLFTASMLLLVVSESIVQFITAWELVGVCSFALIGHWWEDKNNSDAALKAFLTNRVGDMGLLIGMIILFFTAGAAKTFSIPDIAGAAAAGTVSKTALTVASLCLIAAVMSKSGQFFLHTWLPDAMAGPTPVSALIHAATMVVAGVFMVARLYPVFFEGLSIAGSSWNMLALVGAITTLVGGSLAFVQTDIKKVLAYSTVSQLGYMVLGLGVGAWTGAVFHLFTHAFFKACLFLAAGSVSHACHHSFEMKKDMGGLRKYMPRTHATFLIATIALAGLPPLAGFWSKDEILAGTGGLGLVDGANGSYHLMLVMGIVAAAMTAAYMTRCYYLTFCGEYRGHEHPHESGPRITIPLLILAGLAVVAGFFNFPFGPDSIKYRFEHYVEPKSGYFVQGIQHASFSVPLAVISTLIALGGVVLAYVYYFQRVFKLDPKATELPNGLTTTNAVARVGYQILRNKFYLDWLYNDVIVRHTKTTLARMVNWFNQHILDGIVNGTARGARQAATFTYDVLDQTIVDGVVNGSGLVSSETGGLLRRIQTGRVQQYGALLFAAAAVLAGVLVAAIQLQ
ncbi:MAG: NADH-quinone oxidoreductase subunit L [Acidimicrobiia bacterium]|nr:NADH-quinone oxidoreductase subunit L [Acidimicrobiia bacterium]